MLFSFISLSLHLVMLHRAILVSLTVGRSWPQKKTLSALSSGLSLFLFSPFAVPGFETHHVSIRSHHFPNKNHHFSDTRCMIYVFLSRVRNFGLFQAKFSIYVFFWYGSAKAQS